MNKKTSNALEILQDVFGRDPKYQEMLSEERVMAQAARAIRSARAHAKLTQKQLAERIGTSQSAIARIEDGDYDGHTLALLERVARALDCRVEVQFVSTISTNRSSEKVSAQAEALISYVKAEILDVVRDAISQCLQLNYVARAPIAVQLYGIQLNPPLRVPAENVFFPHLHPTRSLPLFVDPNSYSLINYGPQAMTDAGEKRINLGSPTPFSTTRAAAYIED